MQVDEAYRAKKVHLRNKCPCSFLTGGRGSNYLIPQQTCLGSQPPGDFSKTLTQTETDLLLIQLPCFPFG